VLLRVYRRAPYRLFGSPVPLRRFDALVVFRHASRRSTVRKNGVLSQASDPLQRPLLALPGGRWTEVSVRRAPPMRFLPLQRSKVVGSAGFESRSPDSHPVAIPPWPFSDLRGLDLHRPLQPCFMLLTLMGFSPSELLPGCGLYRARRSAIPSRRFSSARRLKPRPQGFLYRVQSDIRSASIASRGRPLLSWSFIRLHGVLGAGPGPVYLNGASAPGLRFGALLARLRSRPSAFP